MANSIALSSNKNDIVFTENGNPQNLALSGNGVNLSTNENEEVVAEEAPDAPSGNEDTYAVSSVKDISFDPPTQSVEFIGTTDIIMGRYSVATSSINVRRENTNFVVTF